MKKIFIFIVCILPLFTNAMEVTKQKKFLQSNGTTEVWLDRMFYGGKTGCIVIKQRKDEKISFTIPYFFDDAEELSISKLHLSNDSKYVMIIRNNLAVICQLSTKSHTEFVAKKVNKNFDSPYGIVKDIYEVTFQKPISSIFLYPNNIASVLEEDDSLSLIDLNSLNEQTNNHRG